MRSGLLEKAFPGDEAARLVRMVEGLVPLLADDGRAADLARHAASQAVDLLARSGVAPLDLG